MKAAVKVYRFGDVELDLVRYEIRRSGGRLRLSRIPMELLIFLVERRGTLVTREEIIRHLWIEPASIDVVQGVNAAMKRVRACLNDDPSNPRFIETIVGKGYRFIGEVEEIAIAEPLPQSHPIESIEISVSHPLLVTEQLSTAIYEPRLQRKSQSAWLVSAASFCGIAILLLAGWMLGNRTAHPGSKEAAFRFVQMTANEADNPVSASALRGDAKALAYADASGLFLRPLSGPARPLSAPEHFSVGSLRWFTDGSRLLVSGVAASSQTNQIWTVFSNGRSPQLVASHAKNGVPSYDGKRIAFTNSAGTEILVANSDGSHAALALTGSGYDTFPLLLWSVDGKLQFERRHFQVSDVESNPFGPEFDANYIWFYEVLDLASHRIVAAIQDFRMDSACPAANGKLLFAVRLSANANLLQEIAIEPKKSTLLLPPRVIRDLNANAVSSLSCSSDGSIAFAVLLRGQPNVFTAELDPSAHSLKEIRRLSFGLGQDYPHAWTPDSRSVIFESGRRGSYGIFKQAIDEKAPELLVDTPAQEVLPQVTPDGRWVLYAESDGGAPAGIRRLMRVPLTGGQTEPVSIGGTLDEFRCPLAGHQGCVLRETKTDRAFVYYSLDPLSGKGEELARRNWAPNVLGDWDVSPDGHSLAIALHNPADARVLILPLKGSRSLAKPRELAFKNAGTVWSAIWTADGQGLYISVKDARGASLLYSDLAGRTCLLKRMREPTLAVPSPDGKRLAFWDYTSNQNVWLVQ